MRVSIGSSLGTALGVAALVTVVAVGAPVAPIQGVGLGVDSAEAGSFRKCNPVKKARRFKIKKIKVTRPVPCRDARKVTKKWVQRRFDQNNAIQRRGRNWFCTWRKRSPGSVDTGTADCEAGASDEIRYVVRKR